MNSDSPSPGEGPDRPSRPDSDYPPRPIESTWDGAQTTTVTYAFEVSRAEPAWCVDHDRETGIFRLTGPEGQTECFRDKAARYLVVEHDPATGRMTPVIRDGRPRILCLCREEPGRR